MKIQFEPLAKIAYNIESTISLSWDKPAMPAASQFSDDTVSFTLSEANIQQ